MTSFSLASQDCIGGVKARIVRHQRNNATFGGWRNSDTACCVVYHQHFTEHRCPMGVVKAILAGDNRNLGTLRSL